MCSERTTVVDFVAEGNTPDEWKMVLVEEGPWNGPIDANLRRLQDRMYGCIDAALDGQLSDSFPMSLGKKVVIQLDCYNVPRDDVADFFRKFSEGVFATDDYRQALEQCRFVSGISFEINFDELR